MARKQGSHSDITGPRLQAAAVALIARHGFAAVSMRQIAAEVGLQAGALYNYITDKQTLLSDLMRGHMDDVLTALAGQDLTGEPMDALRTFVRFHITFHLPRRDAVFVSYMELRNLSAENFERIEAMRRQYENALEDVLRRGVESGKMSVPDTRIATRGIIAQLTGITNWYDPEGPMDIDTVAGIYTELVCKSVAPDT